MAPKNLVNKLCNQINSDFSTTGKIILVWGLIDYFLLSIYDVSVGNMGMLVYSAIVLLSYFGMYIVKPKRFTSTILFLTLLEETLAYYIGGGLHGLATSIWEDYVKSIPVFVSIALLWRRYMYKYKANPNEILILVGTQGFFFEIILSGAILKPIYVLVLGGTPYIVYGLLVLIPEKPLGEEEIKLVRKIFHWITYLIITVAIGIICSIIYDAIKI